jgi:hypothetical protein
MSEDERREGKYSFQTRSKALGALHQDGLVVLKGVIPVEMIDKLNAKMCQDADERISDPSQGYNHGVKCEHLRLNITPMSVLTYHIIKPICFKGPQLRTLNTSARRCSLISFSSSWQTRM